MSTDFGIKPGSTTITAENPDGTVATQAGPYPYTFTAHFELKTDDRGHSEGGSMRTLSTHLPPGLIGNPSTQVGVARAILPDIGEANGPIYNLVPPPGVVAQLKIDDRGHTEGGSR